MKRRLKRLLVRTLTVVALLSQGQLWGQERAQLVTYGPSAAASEGDPDYVQLFFFLVPVEHKGTLYLRIFDPDIGGAHDTAYREFNSKTRFNLYGSSVGYTSGAARAIHPEDIVIHAGSLIRDEVFGTDPSIDNTWYNFAQLNPADGEESSDYRVFKLVVSGISGDDANVFDLAASSSPTLNQVPEGVRVITYSPTVRLASSRLMAEMPIAIQEGVDTITVGNFDAASASIALETAYRSLSVSASEQGNWTEGRLHLSADEMGEPIAVSFLGGSEIPNDATFFAVGANGEELPFLLPFGLFVKNTRPVADLKVTTLADCRSVSFDASGSVDAEGDELSYEWSFGDGGTGQGNPIVHTYSGRGPYWVSLSLRDSSAQIGNGTSMQVPVTLNQTPQADAGDDRVVAPGTLVEFDGSSSSDLDGHIVRYSWDFDDGTQATRPRVSHRFNRPGHYQVSLQVADNSIGPCNVSTDQVSVTVNSPPVAEAGEDQLASVGEELQFDAGQSYDVDGKILRFSWEFGDGSRELGPSIRHVFSKSGEYTVRLVVTDDSGVANDSASDFLKVRINHPPVARAGGDRRAAVGQAVDLDATQSSDIDGSVLDYSWDFGDGSYGNGPKVSYAYPRAGSYQVRLTVKDNSGTRSNTATDYLTVTVNERPKANAGSNRSTTESEIRFDASDSIDSDGRIVSYRWDFGDGTSSNERAPVHVYRKAGTYKVRLEVTDDSGTITGYDRDEVVVVLNSLPIADGGADQIGAPGQVLTFSGTGSVDPDGEIARYDWDFGDGTSTSGAVVTHSYQQPGTYTVRLAVSDQTGHSQAQDFDDVRVTINQAPVAVAGPDIVAAPGDLVILDGRKSYDPDGKISRYAWFLNHSGETLGEPEVRRHFSVPGIYTARLTVVDDSGAVNGTAEDQLTIRINDRPTAVPGEEVFTCDTTVLFDAGLSSDPDGDPLTYQWDFGDGTPPLTGSRVTHTYSKGGSYPVALRVSDGRGLSNSEDTAATKVTINQPPKAVAGENAQVCVGDVVLLDGGRSQDPEGGLLRYRWSFGDGTEAFGINPTKTFAQPGTFPVVLTVEDDSSLSCNQDSDQVFVDVLESVIADAGPDLNVCAGTVVRFDGSNSKDIDGVVNRFVWDFGDGATGGGATPSHGYDTPGTYRVRLTVEGERIADCTNFATDEIILTVSEAPEAQFIVPSRIAQGELVTFDGSQSLGGMGTVNAWNWDFGDGNSAQGRIVTYAFEQAGKYIVTLTIGADGVGTDCREVSLRQQVIVNTAPVADAGPDQVAGINEEVLFSGSGSHDSDGGIARYEWDFGDGTRTEGVNVRHRYANPGSYEVRLTVVDNANVSNSVTIDSAKVTINRTPEARITAPQNVCVGEDSRFSGSQSFDPDGQITGYWWDFGDGAKAEGAEAIHRFDSPGSYQITFRVRDDSAVKNNQAESTALVRVNIPPTAVAGTDRIVCPGVPTLFDASASYDPDGNIVDYSWDFGDGLVAPGMQIEQAFRQIGSTKVSLEVRDDSGTSCGIHRDQVDVRVNSMPDADAGGDQEGFSGGANDGIFFDASASSDADGDPLTYFWDFGDGETGTGQKVFHRYEQEGTYRVRLKVSDGTRTTCGEGLDEVNVTIRSR